MGNLGAGSSQVSSTLMKADLWSLVMGEHMPLEQIYLDLEHLGQPCCQLLRMGRVEDERSPLPHPVFKKICHVKARIKLTCWKLKSQGLEIVGVKSTKEWDS